MCKSVLAPLFAPQGERFKAAAKAVELFARCSPIIPFMGVRRERDYLVRAREQGQACVACGRFLPGPPSADRRCDDCAKIPTHHIYMAFSHRDAWHCQFLEADLKTPLPPKLTFATSDKLRELAQRGGAFKNLES